MAWTTATATLTLCALTVGSAARAQQCQPEWVPTFDAAPGLDAHVRALAVFDSGSGPELYAGGDFSSAAGVQAEFIAKWNGTNWSAVGGGTNGVVRALTVFDDGTGPALYAGGSFDVAGGVPTEHVAKWNGTSWSALAGGAPDRNVNALTVADDGSGPALFAGGDFFFAGPVEADRIAKWNGTSWSPLGDGIIDDGVLTLVEFDDGSGPALYAGGYFGAVTPTVIEENIARWDGTEWTAVGGGITQAVLSLTVFDGGGGPELFAGGDFGVRSWNGTTWSEVGGGTTPNSNRNVFTLAVADDGSGDALYAHGMLVAAGGVSTRRIARWNGTVWSDVGGGLDITFVPPGTAAIVGYDDGTGPAVYVGGSFFGAGPSDLPTLRIAKWDGTEWSALGPPGLDSQVLALGSYDDGNGPALYAGGDFSRAGVAIADQLVRRDGDDWVSIGANPVDSFGQPVGIDAMQSFDPGGGELLFVGGRFEVIGGLPSVGVASWDGTSWSSVPSLSSGWANAFAIHDDGTGTALYAGGNLSFGDELNVDVGRWDGTSWTRLGSGIGGSGFTYVQTLAVFDDGSGGGPELYAGGRFSIASGVPASNFAKWDGIQWLEVGGGTSNTVNSLVVHDDGTGPALYVGGGFTSAGGVPFDRIARWDGTSWSAVGSGVGSTVYSLHVHDDGSGEALYAGGFFLTAGGSPALSVARWDGSSWSALGGGLNGSAFAMTTFDAGDCAGPALIVGGSFFSANDSGDSRIARWGCAPLGPTSYCTAGTSTNGCLASVSATGTPSVSTPSGFDVVVSQMEGQKLGTIFYGVSGPTALPWGMGSSFLCVQPPTRRTGTQGSGGTNGLCDGAFVLDFNAFMASEPSALGQPFGPGDNVWIQGWHRDPPAAKTTSLSNALQFCILP